MTNFRIYNENEVDQSINDIKTFLLENNIDENKVNVLSVAIKEMSNVLKQYNKRNIINSMTFSITDDQILITNKNNGDYITPEQKKAEFFAIENHPAFSSIYVEEDYEIYIISSFNCVSLKTSKN